MIKRIFIILLGLNIILTSCKKNEDIYDTPQDTVNYVDFHDINWVVEGGYFYVEDMDNNTYTYYDHFGVQDTSFLNPFSGPALDFDVVIKNSTTWNFNSNGKFILNDSTIYDYEYYLNGFKDEVITPYGFLSGTSRPIQILDLNETTLWVLVNEGYSGYKGTQYGYHTVLTLIREGSTCDDCLPDPQKAWDHHCQGIACNGHIVDNSYYQDGGNLEIEVELPEETLYNTKWVVTKIVSDFATDYPNDTLHFFTHYNGNGRYSVNGNGDKYYRLTNVPNTNMETLLLSSFTPLNGDWEGEVQDSFLEDGEINNVQFHDIFSNRTAKVWMERIQ